jgi:predicted Zn-dependent protease
MILRAGVLALATVFLAVAQQPVRGGLNSSVTEKEAALGAGLAAEMQKDTSPVNDAVIQDWVSDLGRRLAGQDDRPWRFQVISNDVGGSTHEPRWFPGGYIFVPASLIAAAANESEVAGMLAHSMAHVIGRDGMRTSVDGQTIPLIFIGGWNNEEDGVFPAGLLSAQRTSEFEADRRAAGIIEAAGYGSSALLEYIARTQRDRSGSALPVREQRIGALQALVSTSPPPQPPSPEFAALQDRARELLTAPRREPPTLRRKNER